MLYATKEMILRDIEALPPDYNAMSKNNTT